MEDEQIIALFFQRSPDALPETRQKYGALCQSIARKILPDQRDVEECVSDMLMRLWNVIPPERPRSLSAYIVRITRNLSLDRYSYNMAEQRSTALTQAFEELELWLPAGSGDPEQAFDQNHFHTVMNDFLRALPKETRAFFLRRYWYGDSIREIADAFRVSEAKVKTSLFRTRQRLRETLDKEGIVI